MQDAECDSLTAVGRRWGDALQALAEQFCRGWAAVDPIDEIQACRYCDLTTLCRIREAAAAGDEGEG